jgi:putative FmdB family regulatory protein|tara:strand:+ start:144 stop:299 length:156 start_codon:yes stop_codon:yes gene_type:complete
MPLYEYICNNENCEKETFEVLSGYEESPKPCPVCKESSKDRKKFYQFDFRM